MVQFLYILVCLFAASVQLYSAPLSSDAWKLLDQAQQAYDYGDFGKALLLCDEARQVHASLVTGYIRDLENAFSPQQVKRAGDDLSAVYAVLVERNDIVAKGILDAIFLNYPQDFFGRSVSRMMNWLSTRLVYPEADVIAGNVYRSEGEYPLALSYYEKAWLDRDAFDIPDERFILAYAMADLAAAQGSYGEQEKYLLLIVKEDSAFGLPGHEPATLTALLRTLSGEKTLEKFFSLYRHGNFVGMQAYKNLAELYSRSSRPERALPAAALGAVIAVTSLSKAVSARDFSWSYTKTSELFSKAGQNREIFLWAQNAGIWQMLEVFAEVLLDSRYASQAHYLYAELAAFCPDADTARRAASVLEVIRPIGD